MPPPNTTHTPTSPSPILSLYPPPHILVYYMQVVAGPAFASGGYGLQDIERWITSWLYSRLGLGLDCLLCTITRPFSRISHSFSALTFQAEPPSWVHFLFFTLGLGCIVLIGGATAEPNQGVVTELTH